MKTKKRRPLSWTPRSGFDRDKGPTFCAPACGGGCTRAQFEHATTEARVLAARLGPKFRPRVWENLGWHWSARTRCSRIDVHPPHRGGRLFSAYINRDGETGGQFVGHGRTPLAAIRDAFRQAAARRDELNSLLSVADQCKIRL